MTLPKLKRKARGIWRKSAKRLGFGFLKQIAVVVLLFGLTIYGFSAIGGTSGFFSDTEASFANVFSAGQFDLAATPQGDFTPVSLLPGQSANRHIDVSGESMPFNYNISASGSFGDFCNSLILEVKRDGNIKYIGSITDLNLSPVASMSAGPADWEFTATLPADSPEFPGETCQFDFVFTGRQGNTDGFSDIEEVPAIIGGNQQPPLNPSGVVLNEFLPNPIGNDRANMPDGEWVELYNVGDTDVDVFGWFIYDNDNNNEIEIVPARTNTHGTIVPAGGFLVVYRHNDPDFALNNTGGDSVRLYNARISHGGALIDSHIYTIDAPENKSFARIPDGTGPWFDPIPTPGGPNVLEGEQEPIVDIQNENQSASSSFSETLGGAAADAVTGFVLDEEGVAASPSAGTVVDVSDLAPVASESVEPLVEPPLDSPAGDLTGQALPELSETTEPANDPQPPASDGSSVQTPTDPAIPVEPVTVEVPTEPVPPPADPPLPTSPSENLGGQAVPLAEAPAPAPEAPAAPVE